MKFFEKAGNMISKPFSKLVKKETDLNLSDTDKSKLKHLDSNIVVGKILVIRSHKDPSITKVKVTLCDLGDKKDTQVLCGGTNIKEGQIVAVAKIGTEFPGDFQIGIREIRGEASHGMICSQEELNLSPINEHPGEIWELPKGLEEKIGTPICEL